QVDPHSSVGIDLGLGLIRLEDLVAQALGDLEGFRQRPRGEVGGELDEEAELVVVQDEPGGATLGGEDVMHPVRLVQCGRRVGRGWFGQRCGHCSTSGELVGHDGCSSITLFCGGATTFSRVVALRVGEPPVATTTLAPPLAAQNRRATMRITYSLRQQKV